MLVRAVQPQHFREPIEHRLRHLQQQRDLQCEKSAAEEYGEGSMTPVARAVCAARATQRLIDNSEQ